MTGVQQMEASTAQTANTGEWGVLPSSLERSCSWRPEHIGEGGSVVTINQRDMSLAQSPLAEREHGEYWWLESPPYH